MRCNITAIATAVLVIFLVAQWSLLDSYTGGIEGDEDDGVLINFQHGQRPPRRYIDGSQGLSTLHPGARSNSVIGRSRHQSSSQFVSPEGFWKSSTISTEQKPLDPEILKIYTASSTNASITFRISDFRPNRRSGFGGVCYIDLCEVKDLQNLQALADCDPSHDCVSSFEVLSDLVTVHFTSGCVQGKQLATNSSSAIWSSQGYAPMDGKVLGMGGYFVLAGMTHNCSIKKDQECQLRNPDAQKALARAKTNQCKNMITSITCASQSGRLYPDLKSDRSPTCGQLRVDINTSISPLVPLSKPVRIAFMLVCHGRSFRQVLRVLKMIYRREHHYLIHVDSRSDYLFRALADFTSRYPNIAMTGWRMATIWGGSNLYEVYLKGIQDLIHLDWDYFINLSGADLPIRPIEELIAFFGVYRSMGASFLKSNKNHPRFVKKQGLDRTFVLCDNHMFRVGNRKLPDELIIEGGSDWYMLHKEFCSYVISQNQFVVDLKAWYNQTLLGAESFFHVALANGPMCGTFFGNNLRLANWNRKRGCHCQYKAIVDWCGCSPNVFLSSDFRKLKDAANRGIFFARKFDGKISSSIIDRVESELLGVPSYLVKDYYWENTYKSLVDHTAAPQLLPYFSSWSHLTNLPLCSHLMEANIVFGNDTFIGYALTFYDSKTHSSGTEVLVKPKPSQVNGVQALITPGARVLSLNVGTNYDQKERVFNRWGGLLSVTDEGNAVAIWSTTVGLVFKAIWEAPDGHKIQESGHMKAGDEVWVSESHAFRQPGMWRLVLSVQDGRILIQKTFPVVNVHRTAQDESIRDSLVSQFWEVADHCALKNSTCNPFAKVACTSTAWSSHRAQSMIIGLE